MLSLTILVRKFYNAAKFVCPLMTIFCFYYFCVVDFRGAIMPVYNVIVVGTAINYLVLSFFVENWLLQAVISVPIFSVLTWRQSSAVLEE